MESTDPHDPAPRPKFCNPNTPCQMIGISSTERLAVVVYEYIWKESEIFHQNESLRVSSIHSHGRYTPANSPIVVWSSGMTSRCGWRTPSVPIQIRASLGSSTFDPSQMVVLRHLLTCLQFPVPPNLRHIFFALVLDSNLSISTENILFALLHQSA